MSVTVKHLNGDSTFLLTFSPEPHPQPADLEAANGAFTVLIDPWLSGSSIVSAPWFAITKLVVPSAIQHLSEIDEPDVVVVSQNKPDHCHRETLLQLNPEGKTIIAAEPGAAKAIKSWNHFDPNRVHKLHKYDPKARFGNALRVRIPALAPEGQAGEVNISFIPAKNYVTGLHNAFGITYQAPTRVRTLAVVPTRELPRAPQYFHLPLSRPTTLPSGSPPTPMSPTFVRPRSLEAPSLETLTEADFQHLHLGLTSHQLPPSRASDLGAADSFSFSTPRGHTAISSEDSKPELTTWADFDLSPDGSLGHAQMIDFDSYPAYHALPTPPESPIASLPSQADSTRSGLSSVSTCNADALRPLIAGRPKAISILYSPHGLPVADLKPYVTNHLVRLPGALPLTLLLHSFDHVQNPWYLGGNIMAGTPGGASIARALMARCWLSAHDEPKEDRGVSVKQLKIRRHAAEEVRRTLWQGEDGRDFRLKGWTCDVRSLGVGKEMLVRGAERDLLVGSVG